MGRIAVHGIDLIVMAHPHLKEDVGNRLVGRVIVGKTLVKSVGFLIAPQIESGIRRLEFSQGSHRTEGVALF